MVETSRRQSRMEVSSVGGQGPRRSCSAIVGTEALRSTTKPSRFGHLAQVNNNNNNKLQLGYHPLAVKVPQRLQGHFAS